ncbi:MAG: lipocalin family protein [Flavobacteriaceae bacterium]|nr:lipocalin family protein [Flavobacteriaceae bacterium]
MKKLNLVCIILIGLMIFSSCSSHDDSNSDSIIIGVWKSIKRVHVCATGNEVIEDFPTCVQESRLTFKSNGTFNDINYVSDDTGTCMLFTENGTWTLIGNNPSFTTDGATRNPTFFELTSTTLRIGYYTNYPIDFCSGGAYSHFYTEFIRVE